MRPRAWGRLVVAAVVVSLACAETASAAPGYRYELNPDETYTPGTVPEFTGVNGASGITAPFEVGLYGTRGVQLLVATRGYLQFTGTVNTSARECLPSDNPGGPAILPFFANSANLAGNMPGYGIYSATDGAAPNRRWIVDFRLFKPGMTPVNRNFEVIFYESSPIVTTVYSTPGVSGADATIGIQASDTGPHTQYSCGSTSIPGGSFRIDYIPDPRNLSPPVVTGTARSGEPFTGTQGTWDGTAPITYGYQWLRCDAADTDDCVEIAGATGLTYTPGDADVNRRLRLRVTATTMPFPYTYDDTADSAATAIVAAPPGTGGTGGPGGQNAAPQITSLSVSPRRLTRRNRRRGRILYALSEAATTRFAVQKAAPGRRVGGRCVRPTRRNANAPRCRRFVSMRPRLTHIGGLGQNQMAFRARLGRRRLRPGSYRVVAVARDAAGLASGPRRARFRVR